jgi:hypothetical protein
MQRAVRAAAASPDGGAVREFRLEQVREATDDERLWHFAVFLAAEQDRLIGATRGAVGSSIGLASR